MNKTNLVRCSVLLLLLGACGAGETDEFGQVETETDVRKVSVDDGPPLFGFVDGVDTSDSALETVDKGFIDDSLSCNSIPSLSCPNILLSAANGSIDLAVAGNPSLGVIFPRNPAAPVRETLPARPTGVTLDTISCGPQSGSVAYVDIFQFRLPVEVESQARILDSRTVGFGRNVFPSNYPGGMMDRFVCRDRSFSLSAPGFRSQAPQFRAELLSAFMDPDANTPNDGEAFFQIACGYSVAGPQLSADRPRDVLDANASGFVTAPSFSATQIQQRCNNLCFNDCSVQFGVDAQGAQFCTDVCTPDCVSRATTNTGDCPSCNQCSQASDCGAPSNFTCTTGGCCAQRIF
jgi:hypothetical protein